MVHRACWYLGVVLGLLAFLAAGCRGPDEELSATSQALSQPGQIVLGLPAGYSHMNVAICARIPKRVVIAAPTRDTRQLT